MAELLRAALLGAGLRLFAGRVRAGPHLVPELAVFESGVRGIAGRLEILPLDSARGLGSRLFLLGLGRGSICARRSEASGVLHTAYDIGIAAGAGDGAEIAGPGGAGVLLVDVYRRRIYRGRTARRRAGVSSEPDGDGGGAGGRNVVGTGRGAAAAIRAMVRPAALHRNICAGDSGPGGGNGAVAMAYLARDASPDRDRKSVV